MPEIQPWHLTYLKDPDFNRVDLVKAGANSQAKIMLYKSRGGEKMTIQEILKALKPEHQQIIKKAFDDKDVEIKKIQEDLEKAENLSKSKSLEGQSEEEIIKSIEDPAIRALMETQIAKTKAAEEEVKKAKEERQNVAAIAKAKELVNLGVEEAKMVEIYKKLSTTDSGLCEEVFDVFKTANALIAKGGVFKEIGVGTGNVEPGSTNEKDAWDAIEKAAAQIDGISKSAAIAQVIKDNPNLYEAYIKSQE